MAELLTAEQALNTLHEHGQDANSDYNDAEEVEGYFGWTVRGDALIVTHQVDDDGFEDPANKVMHWWRLVPIADEAVPGDLAAEGEEWVRGYVAAWKPRGLRDALRAEALLVEYDRRGTEVARLGAVCADMNRIRNEAAAASAALAGTTTPTYLDLLRAIADPGSILARGDLQPDGISDYRESIASWGARAVQALLASTPTTEETDGDH